MVRLRNLAAFSLAILMAAPALARAEQKQCDFQPEIVTLSDYVLKNRASLTRFKSLRYGAISAYLKIRYAKPPPREVEAMLMPMAQARVARADELLFAWAINTYGVDAAIAIMGQKSADLLLVQGLAPSALRAAIVKEGLPALTDQMMGLTPDKKFQLETKVAPVLLDKFDTYKGELAREAEEKGLLQVAAGLTATESDPAAWKEFAARQTDKAVLERALSYWYWAPALVGQPALPREGLKADGAKVRDDLHFSTIVAARMPERDFLMTYLNYTGALDQTRKVGETILTLADDTSGAPWTMDRAWIAAYLELIASSDDPESVDKALRSIPFGGLRHYDGSVRDVLDWMIAADALKPYLAGTSDDLSQPGLLSGEFAKSWAEWQEIAEAIRAGSDLKPYTAEPDTLAITAELLHAAGKEKALATFIAHAHPDDASVNLAEDFANRMDRICYGYLNFPAEAITFPDTPLFRFD